MWPLKRNYTSHPISAGPLQTLLEHHFLTCKHYQKLSAYVDARRMESWSVVHRLPFVGTELVVWYDSEQAYCLRDTLLWRMFAIGDIKRLSLPSLKQWTPVVNTYTVFASSYLLPLSSISHRSLVEMRVLTCSSSSQSDRWDWSVRWEVI